LEAKDLTVYDNRGLPAVKRLSLSLRGGEILGIAAIEGNGQSELLESLTGLRPCIQGSVSLCGCDATNRSPGELRSMGLAHIPEDRLVTGVSKDATVAENMLIGRQRESEFRGKAGYQKQSSIVRYAQSLFDSFDIRGAGVQVAAGSLSGGNLQKLVVARECSYDTPVLIISQPTRGVDVGAIEFIHKVIIQKRNEGKAILLSSADLDEVYRLSDRIITLYEGQITGEFTPDSIEKDELGYYMTGNRRKEGEAHEAPTL
jgi:simple sugar transport system ATP-binding protein